MNQFIRKIDANLTRIMENEIEAYYLLLEIFEWKDIEALRYYASKGLSLNVRNQYLSTMAKFISSSNMDFTEEAIALGLDLNVLDINGNNILHSMLMDNDILISIYALSKGVNPYEDNLKGFSAMDRGTFLKPYATESFITQYSQHSSDSFTYKKAFKEKNFPLALSILQDMIERMGGLNRLAENLDSINIYDLFRRLYNVLILNKNYEAATAVLKIYLQKMENSNENLMFADTVPLGIIAPIMLGDLETAQKIAAVNLKNSHGLYKRFSIAHSYPLLKRLDLESSEFMKDYRREGRNSIREADGESLLSKINLYTFMKTIPLPENFFLDIEEDMADADGDTFELAYLFNLGTLALHKEDYSMAEYNFIRVITRIAKFNDYNESLVVQAHAMLDYLDQL